MQPELRQRYRRIRNIWGWIIAFGWIAFWYFKLTADYHAYVATLGDCSGIFASVRCGAASSGARFSFGFGLILAMLTAPLAFVVSHYLARSVAEAKQAGDDRRKTDETRAAQERLEAERAERLEQIETGAQGERLALDRKEFIRKLGTASDALDLLNEEAEPARRLIARQAATNALRDLIAKHTLPEMSALLASDDAARLSADALLVRLRRLGPLSPDSLILERAVPFTK